MVADFWRSARVLQASVVVMMLVVAALVSSPAHAQSRPLHRLLPEAEEIALARTAAPAGLSDSADVYVLRRGGHVRVVEGSNGAACLVARDHPESLYPICYDSTAARTVMQQEIFSQRLRERGIWGDSLDAEVSAAHQRGELSPPATIAVVYMMSPHQVIYSGEDGRRVGRWHPHLMIYGPGLSQRSIGFPGYPDGNMQVSDESERMPSLVVFVEWAVPPPLSPQ
jgi:putative hemolysin